MAARFTLRLPKIMFGGGTVERVRDEAERLGGKRILIVTDDAIEKFNLLKEVEKPLGDGPFELNVIKTAAEPRVDAAEKMVETLRLSTFDLVVGIGGGSCMDMAKVASLMYTNPGTVSQYVGINLVQNPGLPKILIPTTAGTGSEVTPNAILARSDNQLKVGIVTPHNIADVAIVDPQMTMTMPARLTATTGLDALSHAIEAYISINSNQFSDALALRAVSSISTSLHSAFADGKDLAARSNMSMAALLAGIAISIAGTCAGHAAAYSFAVKYGFSHGLSCAISLPYIIKYNAVSCFPKIGAIAAALGEKLSGLGPEEVASKAAASITDLMKKLEVPYRLKDLNIPREDIPDLAERMMKTTRLLANNPRNIREEDALQLLENMWQGRTDN